MQKAAEQFSHVPPTIPSLDPERVSLIEQEGLTVKPLEPIGLEVHGADVRSKLPEPVIEALAVEMANRGFVVFKHQTGLSADELVEASKWWGAGEIHSTHGVHPATPGMNRDIFRLSNDNRHGILGVGPQWHNDGSFEAATFSHRAYYMARASEHGGGTHFAHQGAAFDMLPEDKQAFWQRLVSVNSASGVSHPVVHTHPVSGRKSVWLHLGQVQWRAGSEDHGPGHHQVTAQPGTAFRLAAIHRPVRTAPIQQRWCLAGRWCGVSVERRHPHAELTPGDRKVVPEG